MPKLDCRQLDSWRLSVLALLRSQVSPGCGFAIGTDVTSWACVTRLFGEKAHHDQIHHDKTAMKAMPDVSVDGFSCMKPAPWSAVALLFECTICVEPFERNDPYEAFTGRINIQTYLHLGKQMPSSNI
jgi:hypothetical protein